MISVGLADFNDPELKRFLQDHLKDLQPTAPADSRHALDLSALRKPGIRLWIAETEEGIAGTIALAEVDARHEEIKSMRTAPHQRGRGIAARLLQHALENARLRGVTRISLETGSMPFFEAARSLYRKAGFEESAPFGDYTEDPHSVFMTREL